MTQCRICQSDITPFLDLGRQPIANRFLTEQETRQEEYFFQLQVAYCPQCHMVQLVDQPDREMMFHENYAYFSSISTRMQLHFADFAREIMDKYLGDAPFVVEIGSNDGIMLKNFKEKNIPHLGVEPSANVAQAAKDQGIETICRFFDEELGKELADKYSKADVISCANVFCHIPYLDSIIRGVDQLLKPEGVFIFQDPYLGDIIEKTSYDQIYDEHVFFFSVSSVQNCFERFGMEVVDISHHEVHGGSMRYTIARKGSRSVQDIVAKQLEKERQLGLTQLAGFQAYQQKVDQSKTKLVEILKQLKNEGKRVVGYGATSKSTTVTNYCGIGPDLVEFISDTTPTKIDKYNPGTHIPIKTYRSFSENHPDVALLFAWNHGEEIMEKEQAFSQSGGKWLVYVPEVELR